MEITNLIREKVAKAVQELYNLSVDLNSLLLSPTRKEFEGDYTIVVFPFTRAAKKGPADIAKDIGDFLTNEVEEITGYNIIKGFLNLSVTNEFWPKYLQGLYHTKDFGSHPATGKKVIVEYSSPNTNKPLHLGHMRNILLGWASSKIIEKAGNEVVKTQIINDRGIHICKSMIAWQKNGNGETPESTGIKGDHLVGKYYVTFNTLDKEQSAGLDKDQESPIMLEARELLKKWEANDPETIELWKTMNSWVYSGFNETYENLGVSFDVVYYESNTYLLGKDIITKGLEQNIFYKKDDGSVWIDLEDVKLDHKLVLRSDGTSVYMTQDIGTARKRFDDYKMDGMTYVVGDEQNYHFKALFEILKKLGEPYAENLHHLSYGMVNLPEGKMKSREGTVVDADDLISEVIKEVENESKERGELDATPEERQAIWEQVGLGALKYHLLKVNPRKPMVFDPKESVDLQGQTGPYIQYAYVRIQGILRKLNEEVDLNKITEYLDIQPQEKQVLLLLQQYPTIIQKAADNFDPSEVAHYCYNIASAFHKFLHDIKVLTAETEAAKAFRLTLSKTTATVLKSAFELLGIEMPERM